MNNLIIITVLLNTVRSLQQKTLTNMNNLLILSMKIRMSLISENGMPMKFYLKNQSPMDKNINKLTKA